MSAWTSTSSNGRSYGTKTAKVEQPSTDTGKQTVTVEKERDAQHGPLR